MDARRSFTQPRQSVFSAGGSVVPLNEGPANHLSYLHATVQMVARCSSTLGEIADEQKTEGIHDLDRMMRKLFVLIDEPQLKAAQNQLEDEIGPQLNTLLERAEKAIEVLDAKEQSLLSRISAIKSSQAAAVAKASAAASKRGDARRLQILQARREKAERELDEVEAEMRKMVGPLYYR
ncbi:spc19 domain-containing protein [Rhizoctonia solani AG-1 IA]|uniref:DASH complex subunit SPC19 n=1 Tax=Thanatephorus cucumeris (strain AG1-IA) TaxID=983506 RepID=L8WNM9_THACA|nr:spc19 domain-containing protein [Rhizoctonia solani AG-1 IA]